MGPGNDEPQSAAEGLREQILELTSRYAQEAFAPEPFVPGESPVPVAGRVFDGADVQSLVDSSLDFWLTTGRFAAEFERRFARERFDRRHTILVNRGSSANLVAFSSLTSPKLGSRRVQPGDEVITVATGFPTTVNPIVQAGAVPVFLDVDLPTYNIDTTRLDRLQRSLIEALGRDGAEATRLFGSPESEIFEALRWARKIKKAIDTGCQELLARIAGVYPLARIVEACERAAMTGSDRDGKVIIAFDA